VDTSLTMLSKLIGKDLSSFNVYVVPATELALKILGRGITNTAMLGALLSTTQVVRIESVEEVIRGRFRGPIAEKNIEVLRETYRCVRHVRE
ncbi:MAG: 2-oxoacid:acceptor oxidoreductase family protein, partial [Desulfurococcaceae archaeon]|nr:2-oxoacid:acceptor oxidoreductase family protein [Desulfurococcaceae archaeon]